VRAAHGLGDHERLLGWLYVGDVDPAFRARLEASKKPALDPAPFLGRMPQG
ncbi:nitroreductase, partial [Xanthomonas citri pv. citri]|nr:nitroreductase [Xanthomonas citri pv. citri]